MWKIENTADNSTNKVTVTTDGIISVTKPDSVQAFAYVNDAVSGVHHVHVKAGDSVYFKLSNAEDEPSSVKFDYAGETSEVLVPAKYTEEQEMTPAETINLFANPMGRTDTGGAMGTGLGAGLVGGLLGTALFGRNGLNGLNGADGGVATAANVESVVNNTAILQGIADIKAAVPLAEAQVQLALAGSTANINDNISTQSMNLTTQNNMQGLAITNGFGNVNQNLAKFSMDQIIATKDASAANLAATQQASILAERSAWALSQTVTNDGDKTRALIQSIDKSNDSRMITTLANEISDLKNSRNLDAATGNITISNNNAATATAQQQQAQQQQQLQYQILAQLGVLNNDIQSVKQSSVVFNSGRMTDSGNQSAANTRVA